jgi:dihydrofolate synthase/folylpolyglutamate synthase
MMNTKDVAGYMAPLAQHAASLTALSIPGEVNTLPAEETAKIAAGCGMDASVAVSAEDAVAKIVETEPGARILICGSLYLAGAILRENG